MCKICDNLTRAIKLNQSDRTYSILRKEKGTKDFKEVKRVPVEDINKEVNF